MPVGGPLKLETIDLLKAGYFLGKRELGMINIGGDGMVEVDGEKFELAFKEALYIGKGKKEVIFHSRDKSSPAKFYLNSTPAHHTYPTKKVSKKEAEIVTLGALETSNHRTINKLLISLDAGSQLNKVQVQYNFKGTSLPVVTGIAKRKEAGKVWLDEQSGVMGYWEPTHGEDGTIGLGCVFTVPVTGMKTDQVHVFTPGTVSNSQPYVYYTGAAWSKGGHIAGADDWFNYLETFAQRVKQPVTVKMTGK